jgi:hypothetical protein
MHAIGMKKSMGKQLPPLSLMHRFVRRKAACSLQPGQPKSKQANQGNQTH